ncbi:MAG TPA: hypothetical protein VM285_03695, partial [Polyangia bacterium]|nr:hypothetical protein [Polyangia bacterium]
MGTPSFSDLLGRTRQEPTKAPPSFSEAIDNDSAEVQRRGLLDVSTAASRTLNPNDLAESFTLAKRTALPVGVVHRNLDEVRRMAGDREFDPGVFARENPVTADWLAAAAENAGVSQGDWATLGSLERIIGKWERAEVAQFSQRRDDPFSSAPQVVRQARRGLLQEEFERGTAAIPMGRLYTYTTPEQRATPEMQRRIAELRALQRGDLPPHANIVENILRNTANFAPSIIYAASSGLEGGLSGAAAGGSAAALAGPAAPITVPVAAVAGFAVGSAISVWRAGAEMMTGQAIDDFSQLTDENGQRMDPWVADLAGRTVGFVGGATELVPIHYLAKPFGQAGTRIMARAVGKVLTRPTWRGVLAEGALASLKATGAEVGQETVQQALQLAGEQASRSYSNTTDGTAFLDLESSDVVDELLSTAWETFLGTILFGVPGGVTTVVTQMPAITEAQNAEERLAAMGEGAKASKLRERAPDQFRELIEKDIEMHGAVRDISIPIEPFVEYWQAQGVDPAKAALEILGKKQMDRYHQAVASGGDIVIPLADYVTKVAGTDHHAPLSQDIKLRPGQMTGREAKAAQATLDKDLQALRDETEAAAKDVEAGTVAGSEQRVVDDLTAQITATGVYTPEQVKFQVEGIAPMYLGAARRAKKDAWILYSSRNIRIAGPQEAEAIFDALQALKRAKKAGRSPEEITRLGLRLEQMVVGRKSLREALAEEADVAQRVNPAVDAATNRLTRTLRTVTDDALVAEYLALRDRVAAEEGKKKGSEAGALKRVEKELARRGVADPEAFATEHGLVGETFPVSELGDAAAFRRALGQYELSPATVDRLMAIQAEMAARAAEIERTEDPQAKAKLVAENAAAERRVRQLLAQ